MTDPMKATDTRWRWGLAAMVIAALLSVSMVKLLERHRFDGRIPRLAIDLEHPDLLLRSTALAELPRDLAQAPLLHDVLPRDLADYYQEHPSLLSLSGTIRRLAYDHSLSLPERIAATALASPAELALWRNGKGQPEHFVLLLRHNLASRAIAELAKVALPDRQLSIAADLEQGVRLYAIRLNPRDTWLFASHGDRALIASSPGLVLTGDGQPVPSARRLFQRLLDGDAQASSPLAAAFGLAPLAGARHELVAGIDFLSFGYRHFFPGLKALGARLRDDGQWALSVRADAGSRAAWARGARELWPALAHDSGLCSALPLDPSRLRPIAQSIGAASAAALLDDLEPVAAVCWNPAGGLFAPMLALRLRDGGLASRHDEALAEVFDQALRKPADAAAADAAQVDVAGADASTTDSSDSSAGDSSAADESTAKPGAAVDPANGLAALARLEDTQGWRLDGLDDARLWMRAIGHWRGRAIVDGQRGDAVALARIGRLLLVSTDARAIQAAVAVAARSWPALSDQVGAGQASPGQMAGNSAGVGATPVMSIDGPVLARMLDAEVWRVLRPGVTPTFHRVARALLPPRLAAVAALGRIELLLPDPLSGSSPAAAPGSESEAGSLAGGWQPLQVRQSALPARTGSEAPMPRVR